ETPKPSHRFTKKPVAPLLKKPNVNVPLSTRIKSATGVSKPTSKSNAWIYRKLPAKSAKGEKVEEHIRNLNKNNRVDFHVKRSVKNLNAVCGACHECLISSNHDNCLVYSVKSINRKQPKAKNTMRTTKKVYRPKVVTSVKPMWKPTGQHFTLYDSYPLTRILEPTVEPIDLSLSVSSSTKIPMLSKFVAVTLGMESEDSCKKAEITTLNAKTVGNKTSGTTKPANLKVIAPGMYAISPKYTVPQRRTNRETLIPLPKKKQVTF
nr:hypothetical protein [Tanacetum cinerariifolium]